MKKVRWIIGFATCAYAVPFMGYLLLRLLIGDGMWWMAFLNNFLFWGFVPLALMLPLVALLRMPRLIALLIVLLGVGVIRYARVHSELGAKIRLHPNDNQMRPP